MFGWFIAAAAAGGWLVYQWVRNQPNRPPAPPATARERLKPPPSPAEIENVAFLRRLDDCKVTAADITAANDWTEPFMGKLLSLASRLERMQQVIPIAQWPAFAQRVWCAFGPPLVLAPPPDFSNQLGTQLDRHNRTRS
jgi:hypothetical protein